MSVVLVLASCTGQPSADQSTPSTTSVTNTPATVDGRADSGVEAGEDGDSVAEPSADEPTVADPDAAACEDRIDRISLVRQRSVPGGRQLHLSVTGDGDPTASAAACLRVVDQRLGELPIAVSSSASGPGATLIVARWDVDHAEDSRAFVAQYLAASPSDEAIAVWTWTDDVRQLVGSTSDRARITTRLDATPGIAAPGVFDAASVAERAVETWEDIADDALLGHRTVIFVAPDVDLDELPDIDRDVVTDYWWLGTDLGKRTVVAPQDSSGSAARQAAEEISMMLSEQQTDRLVVVGFCDDGGELDLSLTSGERQIRSFGIGDAADEHVGVDCDLQEAAAHAEFVMTTLDVTFADEQRAQYEAAVAAADAQDGRDRVDADRPPDPEWTGSVVWDERNQPVGFTADFRGQSTIACERRSWSIDLDGGDARHLLDASGTDEFVLVSMCADPGYVSQLTGISVMSQFDVWNLQHDTVELRVDGVSQGIYLLIENPDDEFRNDGSLVTSVIRRGYDVADLPSEVKFGDGGQTASLDAYDDVLLATEGPRGDELVEALRMRMDLDQYLRWTAVNVALGSGDYIDEVYFIGEQSIDERHADTAYFSIHGWDPDGLFTECHRGGRLAIVDANGLLVCTESLLDRAIFADDVVYALYVEVLAELTPESFGAATRRSAESIQRWLDVPDVAPAMVELIEIDARASDPAVASQVVNAAAADLASAYVSMHTELLDRIAAFRAGQ